MMESFEREQPGWPAFDSFENPIGLDDEYAVSVRYGVPDGDLLPIEYAEHAVAAPVVGEDMYDDVPPEQHPDVIAARRSFLEEINSSSGDRFTEAVPVRLKTGYMPQTRLWQGVPELSPVLTERPLRSRRELAIETGENGLVYLGPGEEGAVATARLTGCTAAAGVAAYADGSRLAYISHHTPGDDYALRGGGPEAVASVLTARLMRQFCERATGRDGLERLNVTVFRNEGQPAAGGAVGVAARAIATDVRSAATELQDTYGADITIEPYKIAYAGGHFVTVHLDETCSTIYFNDILIAEV